MPARPPNQCVAGGRCQGLAGNDKAYSSWNKVSYAWLPCLPHTVRVQPYMAAKPRHCCASGGAGGTERYACWLGMAACGCLANATSTNSSCKVAASV